MALGVKTENIDQAFVSFRALLALETKMPHALAAVVDQLVTEYLQTVSHLANVWVMRIVH